MGCAKLSASRKDRQPGEIDSNDELHLTFTLFQLLVSRERMRDKER